MKILIIEDDRQIQKYVKEGLEIKGNTVDSAFDGENGYDLAAVESYDAIILDWMLPGMSGLDICRRLRQEQNATPIIMLTAKSMVQDRVSGLNCGADDYLVKPFEFNELLARIRAVSRRGKNLTASSLQVADLIMDLNSYQVTRAGQPVHLTRREFALLELLMGHVNQVLSPEQIIERVWPYDADVTLNSAQVYIGYLRKKIEKPFPNLRPLIKTKRGFGYYLTDSG